MRSDACLNDIYAILQWQFMREYTFVEWEVTSWLVINPPYRLQYSLLNCSIQKRTCFVFLFPSQKFLEIAIHFFNLETVKGKWEGCRELLRAEFTNTHPKTNFFSHYVEFITFVPHRWLYLLKVYKYLSLRLSFFRGRNLNVKRLWSLSLM